MNKISRLVSRKFCFMKSFTRHEGEFANFIAVYVYWHLAPDPLVGDIVVTLLLNVSEETNLSERLREDLREGFE